MFKLPTICIPGIGEVIFVCGGMGANISWPELAGAHARRGGVGVLSSVALDYFVSQWYGKKVGHREAAKLEVEKARMISGGNGAIGMNCMVYIETTYRDSILGAIDGGVNAIFAGAGLAFDLPKIVGDAPVALVPIVGGARALKYLLRSWTRMDPQRLPDAVVLEGPLAGGHLGFKFEEIDDPAFALDKLLPEVLEIANSFGDRSFPVIVAGGIWDKADIAYWMKAGAAGVQLGTRFAACQESGASQEFKEAIVAAKAEDIIIAKTPGSSSGYPFRVLQNSAGYQQALRGERPLRCDWCFMINGGKCRAQDSQDFFCICAALAAASGRNFDKSELPIFTVGANAARVDHIYTLDEIWEELTT